MSLKLPERSESKYAENPDRFGQSTDTSISITATCETIDTRNSPIGPEYICVYARVDEAVRITSEQWL